jgi:transcription-repair coupling factor (superfamily II helicase)
MEKIILKNKNMICYFVADQQSQFYQTPEFIKIVQFIQQSKTGGKMREKNHKLTLTFPNISNVETAEYTLKEVIEFLKN